MATAFDVLPYTIDALVKCVTDASPHTSAESFRSKRHRGYFEEYFNALGAATIVAEHSYIDRDYLEDYAAYYDRCFQDYSRRTHRLHFFSSSFDRGWFESTLVSSNAGGLEQLQGSYLGFVVVKPLPQTVVGRTCLKTYPDDGGRRQFPILRTYPVNLFGLNLTVQSLAYQEQDTVVAACATSALWTCFQGTGKLFQHMIPPPVEITNWAGDHMPEDLLSASARAFPNSGLTGTQMAHAVRKVGLEPFVAGANSKYGLNSLVYAYLRGKIPSILVARLHSDLGTPAANLIGAHAIAMTGFSMSKAAAAGYGQTGFLLKASRIDKLYGHDDQVGPFARMVWDQIQQTTQVQVNGVPQQQVQTFDLLKTSWPGLIHAQPDFVLLPLYHKIRIPFSLIHDVILSIDAAAENLRATFMSNIPRAEWDIYLTTASDYKSGVCDDYQGTNIDALQSLTADLPRFLWRATARTNNDLELDFLFDATGIAQHDLLVHATSSGGPYAQILTAVSLISEKSPQQFLHQATALLKRFKPPPPAGNATVTP